MKKIILLFAICTSLIVSSQTSGIKIKNTAPITFPDDKAEINYKGKNESVYKTESIILFNYNRNKLNSIVSDIEFIKDELYDNSKETDPSTIFSEDIIKVKLARIKELEDNRQKLSKSQDSLYYEYTKEFIQYKRMNIFNGPKTSRAIFEYIYDNDGSKLKVLNNSGFNFGDNTASIYSELVSGNLGIFRVSLGSMISSSNSDDSQEAKEEEAYQRLATYGGNTVLTFEYPLAYIHSRNNQYNLVSRLIAKGSADFPEFGTTTEEFAASGSFGIDIYADASLSNNKLRFFANFNINRVFGTDIYQENLGIQDSSFSFGQLTVGLVVAENIKLSFVLSSYSSIDSLDNRNVIIGGQVLH